MLNQILPTPEQKTISSERIYAAKQEALDRQRIIRSFVDNLAYVSGPCEVEPCIAPQVSLGSEDKIVSDAVDNSSMSDIDVVRARIDKIAASSGASNHMSLS